jgi:hypothetical protein
MADYTITLGPNKEKLLLYAYPDIATALDAIVTQELETILDNVINNETEYRTELDKTRKEEIVALIQDLPTYNEMNP